MRQAVDKAKARQCLGLKLRLNLGTATMTMTLRMCAKDGACLGILVDVKISPRGTDIRLRFLGVLCGRQRVCQEIECG